MQVSLADLPGRSQGQVPISLEEAVTMLQTATRTSQPATAGSFFLEADEALDQHVVRK